MNEEICDTRLQKLLRQKLDNSPEYVRKATKSIRLCGSRVIHSGSIPAVFVVRNDDSAKFYGMTTCKNPWGCPVCSARVMARYASDIAVAIDAVKAKTGQVPIMVTLTVPHTSGMSCLDTTTVLMNTWKDFVVRGNHQLQCSYQANVEGEKWKHNRTKVRKFTGNRTRDPFAAFCEEFNCIHRVRVGEYTYGKRGWHPHFHCLFWVDKKKLQLTKQWEKALTERWLFLAKKHTLKLWNNKYPEKMSDNAARIEIMYSKIDTEGSTAVFISCDDKGNVIEQKSSMYICGWGADRELTGNYKAKATHDGHYTPRQLLEMAQVESDVVKREHLLDLYVEYLMAVKIKRNRRIAFSASGIHKIIEEYKKSREYVEIYKKKATELQRNRGFWRVVCWFSEEQWSSICLLDQYIDAKTKILELAKEKYAKELIENFLLQYDIDCRNNIEHPLTMFIENEIINPSIKAINSNAA